MVGTRRAGGCCSCCAKAGLPKTSDDASAAAARTGRADDEVRAVLEGPEPADERALVAVAQEAERLTQEVRGAV